MAKITHFGVLVRDIDSAIQKWSQLFGLQLVKRLSVEQERVTSAFLSPDGDWRGFMIELVQPMDPEDMGNVVARRLKEHGEGVLHMCTAVDDIVKTKSVFDKSGPSRKSGEARPDLREIEANSQFYLTKARADLDRFRRFCSRFTTFQTRSKDALQSAGVRMVARESVAETGDERLILSPRSVNGVMVEVMSDNEWGAVWKETGGQDM